MNRNLDLSCLRSFVAIADAGGVTRAAGFLNLTQSAVSMQIKRLEEMIGRPLLDRAARQGALTPDGEQLLSYARRLLALNDEAIQRLTTEVHEGEIILGIPHDLVYPVIPEVLQRFARDYPKMRVTLISSVTRVLLQQFGRGECDIILTTEPETPAGAEMLVELPLVWVGARGGQAWKSRPLRLAFETDCIFRKGVQAALDAAGVPWEMRVDGDSSRAIEASVLADLAVHAALAGSELPHVEQIAHGGQLPELQRIKVNLYQAEPAHSPAVTLLAELIRRVYAMTYAGRARLAVA